MTTIILTNITFSLLKINKETLVMKNKSTRILKVILSISLIWVFMSGKSMATNLELVSQCANTGDQVVFTLLLNDAPNGCESIGVDIVYDSDVIEYDSEDFSGTLLENFSFSQVNLVSEGLLRIGAFNAGEAITQGTSGSMVTLTFTVNAETGSDLSLENLKDDIETWTTTDGRVYAMYDISAASDGQGTVTMEPSGGSYCENTQVTMTATPGSCSAFDSWSGDTVTETGTYTATIDIDSDKSVTASFIQETFSITVTDPSYGAVNVQPAGPYCQGDEVTLTAVGDSGWAFSSWGEDLTGSQNPSTITIDDDISVTADFTEELNYNLLVSVSDQGRGTVDLDPIGGTYDEETEVTMTATPIEGWQFVGFTIDDQTYTDNPATITMDENKTFTAIFSRASYVLSFTATGQGTVILDPPGGTYEEGTQVTMTAAPEDGWEFDSYSGDLLGEYNTAIITVDENKTIFASFTQTATQEVAAEAGGGSSSGGGGCFISTFWNF